MLRNRVRASSSDSLDVPMGEMGPGGQYANGGQEPLAYRAPQRRPSKRGGGAGGTLLVALVLAAVAAGGVFYYMKLQQHKLEVQLEQTLAEEKSLVKTLEAEKTSVAAEKHKLHQNLVDTQRSLEELRAQESNRADEGGKAHLDKIKQLVDDKKKVHAAIQHSSLQRLLEKFGPGPHHLRISLAFDPQSNIAKAQGGNRILIEMAPEKDMPHSVYWFLEAVDRGLYNGASFHRNAQHVIQAGPVGNFKTPPNTQIYQKFKESGFESLLFREYSPNFPHKQYTLGFAGLPGGPDFYVSTIDNTVNHGPKSTTYDDLAEADPCFAKVIDGFRAVDRLHKAEINEGDFNRIKHYVAIDEIILLPKEGKK